MRTSGRVSCIGSRVAAKAPQQIIAAQVKHGGSSLGDANDVKGPGAVEAIRIQARGAPMSKLLAVGAGEIGALGRGAGSTKIAFLTISPGLDL
jgi:hypothetical protein